jgi:hypothetical protein
MYCSCYSNTGVLHCDTKLSVVGELGTFVGMILLNLYEIEVEGLGPGPHWHGGAVVATAPPWARAGPLQMAQC